MYDLGYCTDYDNAAATYLSLSLVSPGCQPRVTTAPGLCWEPLASRGSGHQTCLGVTLLVLA